MKYKLPQTNNQQYNYDWYCNILSLIMAICTQLQEINSAIQSVIISALVIQKKCCSSYSKCIDIIVVVIESVLMLLFIQ